MNLTIRTGGGGFREMGGIIEGPTGVTDSGVVISLESPSVLESLMAAPFGLLKLPPVLESLMATTNEISMQDHGHDDRANYRTEASD